MVDAVCRLYMGKVGKTRVYVVVQESQSFENRALFNRQSMEIFKNRIDSR